MAEYGRMARTMMEVEVNMDGLYVYEGLEDKEEFTRDLENILKEDGNDGFTFRIIDDAVYDGEYQRFRAECDISSTLKEDLNKFDTHYNCCSSECVVEWLLPQDDIDVDKLDNICVSIIFRDNDNQDLIGGYAFTPSKNDQIQIKKQIEENVQKVHLMSVEQYLSVSEQKDPVALRISGPGRLTMSFSNSMQEMKVFHEIFYSDSFYVRKVRITIPFDVLFAGIRLLEVMALDDTNLDLQEAEARFKKTFSEAWPERAVELGFDQTADETGNSTEIF